LKEELDLEFKEKFNLEKLKKGYQESLPLLLDNYFTSLLVSGDQKGNDDAQWLERYGISLEDREYLCVRVQLERDEINRDVMDFQKLKLSLRSSLQSILERYDFHHYSFLFNNGIVLLIKEKQPGFLQEIDRVFNEMVKIAQRFLSARINIGISRTYRGLRNLRHAYAEAEKALGQSQFMNSGRIVYADAPASHEHSPVIISPEELRALEQLLKFGEEQEIRQRLKGIRGQAESNGGANLQIFYISLVQLLIQYAQTMESDIPQLLGGDIFQILQGFSSLSSFFEWFESLLFQLREQNLSRRSKGSQSRLDRITLYMGEHYHQPEITMERVSEELGISVSYLSQLFKRHLNTSFVKYLTGIRMEKAREILTHRDDRIVEVASQCGYKDVYYFSHSFKKAVGVSPKKFREEIHSS
ncbi:MAG: helix-turn-helix domain-containing protein, partial [Spirochaetaceae bacterium]|nr:helix-turn-helix domain-containing protein [Spirochaetaceae bacterium]